MSSSSSVRAGPPSRPRDALPRGLSMKEAG